MSDRGKEIFKLLYNLLNRSSSDVKEVFTFVEEILCKNPSLVQSYSLCERNNQIQDTIILFLINWLVRCLGESQHDNDIYLANVKLQYNILTSCLINRPSLFECLVAAYIAALSELCDALPLLLGNDESVMVDVCAFHSEEDYLKEIDDQFEFQVLHVPLHSVNERIQAFLNVLQHALKIGYNVYPTLFHNSLPYVLNALKECVLSTKLTCLRYCNSILQSSLGSGKLMPIVENLSKIVMSALSLLWEQLPLWQRVTVLKLSDLRRLITATIDALATKRGYIQRQQQQQQQQNNDTFEMAFAMLEHATGLNVDNEQPELTRPLVEAVIEFALALKWHLQHELLARDVEKVKILFSLCPRYPRVVRLLAAAVVPAHAETADLIYDFLMEQFCALLDGQQQQQTSTNATTQPSQLLEEICLALMFVQHERELLKIAQSAALQQSSQFNQLWIDASGGGGGGAMCENVAKSIAAFIDHLESIKENATEPVIRIAGRLLECAVLRNLQTPNLQQRLLTLLQQTLQRGFAMTPLKTTKPPAPAPTATAMRCIENALAAADVLFMPYEFKTSSLQKQHHYFITNITASIFERKQHTDATHGKWLATLCDLYCDRLSVMLAAGHIDARQIIGECHRADASLLAALLRNICCICCDASAQILVYSPYAFDNHKGFVVLCGKCTKEPSAAQRGNWNNFYEYKSATGRERPVVAPKWPNTLKALLCRRLFSDKRYEFVAHHLMGDDGIAAAIVVSMFTSEDNIDAISPSALQAVMAKIRSSGDEIIAKFTRILHSHIMQSLKENTTTTMTTTTTGAEAPMSATQLKQARQQRLLQIIDCFAHESLSEHWTLQYFKLTIFYMMHPESHVVYEAVLSARHLCERAGLKVTQLWNWYKRDVLKLIVQLAVFVYLRKGMRLIRSLRAITVMLGYSCVQEFVCKYYRLLVTMLLPYCVKDDRCKGLLIGITKITRKPIETLFAASFLRIYAHICLTETPAVYNRCIELVVSCTNRSIKQLMLADVKQTVAELLIYYNRDAEFVLRAFQCLLLNEANVPVASGGSRKSNSSGASSAALTSFTDKVPSKEFAKFIADRMLGVITYVETSLAQPNFEKPIKLEALESLGQIMRCVGPQNVTQFRFKIIAMLSFVLKLQDRQLQEICLRIWHTFLHIVDIRELGTSLSCIVASLEPLLQSNAPEVNDIYEFIILENASILGEYILDLYFLENLEVVRPAIRQCVARYTEVPLRSERTSLLDKLAFYHRQITNESLPVRLHGFRHLRQFIETHRVELHLMVQQQINVDPLLENTISALLNGCHHEDRELQVAAAKCLGELGAIDPTYLLKQRGASLPEAQAVQKLPLGVTTDEFAIMALMELCRAYHCQKDTKYVDNFSLAMQETLSMCGVSPGEQKKMNVWLALPERMQQVMLPLFTSCYTSSHRESRCKEQPIFGCGNYKRYEDWAFVWASRLIDCVGNEQIKHLLNSYKPSMKRDNNILTFFMPYVLLHALQEGSSEQVEHMVAECQAVFECSNELAQQTHAALNGSNANFADGHLQTTGVKEFPAVKHVLLPSPSNQAPQALEQQSTAPPIQQHSEYVDDIHLLGWNVRHCTKLCSELVDFMACWQREWQQQNSGALVVQALKATPVANESKDSPLFGYKRVQKFLGEMDKLKIANGNFHAGEFARALLYLEEYIMDSAKPLETLQHEIPFLIKIYGQLKEPDAVEGAAHLKQTSLDLSMEILVHRILDRPQDLITCYEQLLSTIGSKNGETFGAQVVKGVLDCYLRLNAPETASLLLDALWQKCDDVYCDDLFKECHTEILWRLGRYDELEELVERSAVATAGDCKNSSWCQQRARAFLHYRRPNETDGGVHFDEFVGMLDAIRSRVLLGMRSHVRGSVTAPSAIYAHSYGEVVKLQLLNDLEKCRLLACNMQRHLRNDATALCLQEAQKFFGDWQMQLRVLQPLVRVMESVLCFRRNLLIEMEFFLRKGSSGRSGFPELQQLIFRQESELWICSAQISRAAGLIQQAQLSLMQCNKNPPVTLQLEQAQLLWAKGEQSGAFKLLNGQLDELEARCGGNVRELPNVERALYAEAKYLQATYNAEAANICAELNLKQFRQAITGNRKSEKCHVQLAQYMERIYDRLTPEQKCEDYGRRLISDVMLNYAKSLRYGCENVYQSLPRLISYWLDLSSQKEAPPSEGSTLKAATSASISADQGFVRKLNELITSCANTLPTALFYTAFSQLLSRICHPSREVYNVLRIIVVKLIEHYPQQSLWMLLPLLKSSYANRIKRCQLILHDASANNASFLKLMTDFNTLAERLIELTNKDVPNVDANYQLSTLVGSLPKLFADASFSSILLPFEKYMQATFPIATSGVSSKLPHFNAASDSGATTAAPLPTTNPFPNRELYITGIDETVCVLRTAARPKKISLRCSDGQHYTVMVKPKDDLRKDFRLMEFNGLVKRYLHQNPDARQRRLQIRTYAAIPFNEECGLVEWLPRLNSFRSICNKIYRSRDLGLTDRLLRQYVVSNTDPIEKKLKIYRDVLLPRHPPVFHEWLRQRFPSPHSWYEARTSYVRTIAVMSMVGYILGLGDRHGENLLFDEMTGDAVHVDFNCLFNQGELFAYPELVPFRLTHNMTFAMGPLGIEGVFRKSCEITLRLLKQEAHTLLSVLRPFVYDLAVLTRKLNNNNKKVAHGTELTDPKALGDVQRIEQRLKGYVKRSTANSMPLSVEGQVNFLIEEATDVNNLAAMYIGWGSYL